MLEQTAALAGRQGSEVHVHAGDGLTAELDHVRVERVLRNLVANALEHGEGRPVHVWVRGDEQSVAVLVRDHGLGLREDEVERVFTRFWRGDPSRARTTGGTGLGLAIALEDARLHGGLLQAWGRPGQGAAFLAHPAAPRPRPARRAGPAAAGPARARGPRAAGRTGAMRRLLAAALGAVLLAGCGLPLSDGVQRPGEVRAEQRLPQPISVLPPGPQPGASAEGVVLGFLTAQTSGRDGHGIARSFLAPAARAGWLDRVGVTVYDPRTVSVSPPQDLGSGVVSVVLTLDVVGDIGPDGAARVQPAQRTQQRYRLRRDADQQWRLMSVPDGVTLTPAGRDRSYDPASVWFLAPGSPSSGPHLAPDLVQLPVDRDRAQAVVDHLLSGPSTGLAGSVDTAVPLGARLRGPVSTSATGEVTVDLTGSAGALPAQTRQDLSAQLVWTLRDALPDFTRLRLLVDGVPLPVPGVGQPQPRTAWAGYDPDGSGPAPAGIAVVAGELRSLAPDGDARAAAAPAPGPGVLDAAVDPRQSRLAVLTGGTTRTLRTGRFAGPLSPVLQDPGLRSPSWGSGDLGVWVLRTGSRPAVLLVPADGGEPVEVQVDGLPPLDPAAVLRVSRDGTRAALVAGGVLQVGRIEQGARRPHLVALRRLGSGVRDASWRTGTVLEVLVEDTEPPLLPLLHLSVDGTVAQVTGLVGVGAGVPTALSAFDDQPLLVETVTDGRSTVYSGDGAGGFAVRLRDASRPSYPR